MLYFFDKHCVALEAFRDLLDLLVAIDGQPTEIALSLGTGIRFAQNKASIDVSGEYIKRDQGSDWR